jgi:hypothetical protein
MLSVDRGNYAPNLAYEDSPQYLGYEQTISAPHMHAHALELLKDKLIPGATVRVFLIFSFICPSFSLWVDRATSGFVAIYK